MAPSAFITGIRGFAGTHLARTLLASAYRVQGCDQANLPPSARDPLAGRVECRACDIRSLPDLAEAVREAKPDVVFHLAAMTYVPEGEKDPRALFEANFTGTLNVLEAIRREAPEARLVLVSSSEVYGKVRPEETPVRVTQPEAPVHLYGLSKLMGEQLVRLYERSHGLSAVILRPFNHIGPGQSDRFVCSSFARQVASIDAGLQEPLLRVGNLRAIRDFTDVRDVVRGYRLAAERCPPGALHQIASGAGVSIEEVLKRILALSDVRVEVQHDPDRMRSTDIPVVVGDPSEFTEATGWRPEVPLAQSLADMVQYWRKRIADEAGGAPPPPGAI